MPAKTPKAKPLPNTLRTTLNALFGAAIEFSVHYPTKNSAVITVKGNLSHQQLRLAVDAGAAMGPNGEIIVLVPDLGKNS